MKKFIEAIPTILIIALIIIIAVILYDYFTKPIVMPPDETKIKQLEKQIEDKTKEIVSLKAERDSLLKANSQIDTQIIYITTGIDSSIAKDSTNAIPEYRQAITLFNWLPDASSLLTFREIGIGAKIITEASGMKLKIKNYESALLKEQEINIKYEDQLSYCNEISKLKDTTIDFWKEEYAKTQSFWYERFIIYTGLGINYNGTNVVTGIQAGIGIKITSIKF